MRFVTYLSYFNKNFHINKNLQIHNVEFLWSEVCWFCVQVFHKREALLGTLKIKCVHVIQVKLNSFKVLHTSGFFSLLIKDLICHLI